jgi:HK97 family phage prohead protease
MTDTKRVTTKADILDGPEGRLTAVISTFDRIDSDGDVVLPSAFTDGQAVPMVWAHDWTRPIGKGVITVEPSRAVWTGELFLDTAAGADAFTTIKRMGDLQEYSWGFQVEQSSLGKFNGEAVRFLERATVFEASPVLVGANRATHTLGIKSGLTLTDHTDAALAACVDVADRYRALAALRAKEGRVLSAANRTRLAGLAEQMRLALVELDGLLSATERQTDDDDEDKGARLFAAFLRDEARRLGVAV